VAEVEIATDALIVHVRGMDRLWALRGRLEIPFAHVVTAEADPELARGWWRGIRSGKAAVAEERERIKEPNLYQDWERLTEQLYELSRRSGEELHGEFTEGQLIEYIEEECYVGEEPHMKE
jgi:hypothetical protein